MAGSDAGRGQASQLLGTTHRWFGARDNDYAGLGDWTVNPEKFPHGLNPLIARVNALGMRFGLWVEPEMVNDEPGR